MSDGTRHRRKRVQGAIRRRNDQVDAFLATRNRFASWIASFDAGASALLSCGAVRTRLAKHRRSVGAVAVVAVGVAAAIYLNPTLAGVILDSVFDMDREAFLWRWIERLSWVFTIVGVVAAVAIALPQLQFIREQLEPAELEIGFDEPYGATPGTGIRRTAVVHPTWRTAVAPFSDPIDVGITVHNTSRRKPARNVTLNFLIPNQLAAVSLSGGRALQDQSGEHRMVPETISINAGSHTVYFLTFDVPRDLSEFDIKATATTEDGELPDVNLNVRVQPMAPTN